jgi:hypothetical protein
LAAKCVELTSILMESATKVNANLKGQNDANTPKIEGFLMLDAIWVNFEGANGVRKVVPEPEPGYVSIVAERQAAPQLVIIISGSSTISVEYRSRIGHIIGPKNDPGRDV